MPVPETARQRRWSFAAEARGELPPGTARRWARETKRACGPNCSNCIGCRVKRALRSRADAENHCLIGGGRP
jgi:hypothetical protein